MISPAGISGRHACVAALPALHRYGHRFPHVAVRASHNRNSSIGRIFTILDTETIASRALGDILIPLKLTHHIGLSAWA